MGMFAPGRLGRIRAAGNRGVLAAVAGSGWRLRLIGSWPMRRGRSAGLPPRFSLAGTRARPRSRFDCDKTAAAIDRAGLGAVLNLIRGGVARSTCSTAEERSSTSWRRSLRPSRDRTKARASSASYPRSWMACGLDRRWLHARRPWVRRRVRARSLLLVGQPAPMPAAIDGLCGHQRLGFQMLRVGCDAFTSADGPASFWAADATKGATDVRARGPRPHRRTESRPGRAVRPSLLSRQFAASPATVGGRPSNAPTAASSPLSPTAQPKSCCASASMAYR